MPIFHIVEWDRDYRTPSSFFTKEFANADEAREWCRKESWSGLSYHLDPRFEESPREPEPLEYSFR